jgi:hypothetical protein
LNAACVCSRENDKVSEDSEVASVVDPNSWATTCSRSDDDVVQTISGYITAGDEHATREALREGEEAVEHGIISAAIDDDMRSTAGSCTADNIIFAISVNIRRTDSDSAAEGLCVREEISNNASVLTTKNLNTGPATLTGADDHIVVPVPVNVSTRYIDSTGEILLKGKKAKERDSLVLSQCSSIKRNDMRATTGPRADDSILNAIVINVTTSYGHTASELLGESEETRHCSPGL